MSELSVSNAKHLTGHILEITFNDGHQSIVDFSPFIFTVEHPDYERYKDIITFLNYDIEDGNINWDDYTMIFPVNDLYNNKIIKR